MSTEGPLAHIGGPGLERGSLVSALGVDEMSPGCGDRRNMSDEGRAESCASG